MLSPTRRPRWVIWCLGAYALAAAVVLLSPISPSAVIDALMAWIHENPALLFVRQGWVEFGANIVLFIPVGLLVALLFRRLWVGIACAVAISVMVELVQILLPARMATPRDVLANGLGALIGGLIAFGIERAVRRRQARAEAKAVAAVS